MARLHRPILVGFIGRIVGGSLTAGEWLPREVDLAARFEVSRGVVREAIRGLEERRLVHVRHGRGALVQPSARWDMLDADVLTAQLTGPRREDVIEQLRHCRRLLEVDAAGLAAERPGSAVARGVGNMREAVTELGDANDAEGFHDADLAFHRALVDTAGNAALGSLVERVHEALVKARTTRTHSQSRVRGTLIEHRLIADAVAARDPDAARAAMRNHLDAAAARPEPQLVLVDASDPGPSWAPRSSTR